MRPWSSFFRVNLTKILTDKSSVIDIGGGLRISKDSGSRFDENNAWMLPLIKKIDYKILDPIDTYKPDIVGDIHDLPFLDNSLEAIICLAVLEHVENPIKASKEMYRTLKKGGYCFVYVPFLYYYHADKGYYGDYWRFTKDSINFIFKDFSIINIQPVRGAVETWIHISPLGRIKLLANLGYLIDKITGKIKSQQVSGYYVFLIK